MNNINRIKLSGKFTNKEISEHRSHLNGKFKSLIDNSENNAKYSLEIWQDYITVFDAYFDSYETAHQVLTLFLTGIEFGKVLNEKIC